MSSRSVSMCQQPSLTSFIAVETFNIPRENEADVSPDITYQDIQDWHFHQNYGQTPDIFSPAETKRVYLKLILINRLLESSMKNTFAGSSLVSPLNQDAGDHQGCGNSMTINLFFVTGGSEFLGTAIVYRLLNRSSVYHVYLLCRGGLR